MNSNSTFFQYLLVLLTGMMIFGSSSAIAQSDSTPQISDFVAPESPPVPSVSDPSDHSGNWLHEYYNDDAHPAANPMLAPLTAIVTPENPLKAQVYWSMRSPYSYLVLQRITYLNSNYNVDIDVRVIFPVAARTRKDSGKAGSGRWYKWEDAVHDTRRVGKFQGVPFRCAYPDPIKQDLYPPPPASTGMVAPLEEQPYISWLTRLGAAAQLQGKALEYINAVSPLIWGARTPNGKWPEYVEDAVNGMGMDYDAVIKDIRRNPEMHDQVWIDNQVGQQMAGHGGVPLMVFRGEPFFGQDRFDHFVWRLMQNGLTKRPEPRAPFTTKPLRWPAGM